MTVKTDQGSDGQSVKPRWRRLVRDLLIGGVLVVVMSVWQSHSLLPTGQAAPPIVARTLDGGAFDLAALRGKRVLLYFYAPWCGVCKASAGNLTLIRRVFSEAEMAIVPVALSFEDRRQVAQFAANQGLPAPTVMGDEALEKAYQVGAFPTTYVLKADGAVSATSVGYTTTFGLWARLVAANW